jgi:predicted GNAT superfamily acetyltransferase
VVAQSHQGRGWRPALYDDLFTLARGGDIDLVTCEIDADPPNPVSERFHARFGFREVGTQRVSYGGNKRVSLQAVRLGGVPAL